MTEELIGRTESLATHTGVVIAGSRRWRKEVIVGRRTLSMASWSQSTRLEWEAAAETACKRQSLDRMGREHTPSSSPEGKAGKMLPVAMRGAS